MIIYFDTGILLKLYYEEPNSRKAVALVQSYGRPIVFCGLQQTEVRNALYRKCARNEITPLALKEALKAIQRDLDSEVLKVPEIEWRQVWTEADRLTAKFTPFNTMSVTGCTPCCGGITAGCKGVWNDRRSANGTSAKIWTEGSHH